MNISGLIKVSMVDYPGNIACSLFVNSCNFDCFYCHNRQLLDGSEPAIDNDYIMRFLESRKGLLDGVVITGGEPTMQKDLVSYIEKIKAFGYKVKLDTNGSNPKIVLELINKDLCDYYAIDYKAPLSKYKAIACGDGNRVLETIDILMNNNASFEVRTTLIPQISKEDLLVMAKELPIVPKYMINPYRKPIIFLEKDKEKINKKPYTNEEIKKMAKAIKVIQPNVMS